MRVLLSRQARHDLESIVSYRALRNVKSAIDLAHRLRARCRSLARHGERGLALPHSRMPGLRRVMEGEYMIVYAVSEAVEILRILDGRQDIERILRIETSGD